MAKVRLDAGVYIDTLNKDELDDALGAHGEELVKAQERAKLSGIKYIRAPRIQGTVFNGTIGVTGTYVTGTGPQAVIGTGPWGPQQGYAWSVRRVAVGGLANANSTIPDTVGIYRNDNYSPPVCAINASQPMVTFPTLGCVLFGGDKLIIGHIGSQGNGNSYGTLVSAYLQADFDVIEIPAEQLGKLA